MIIAWKQFSDEETDIYIKRSQIFRTSITYGDEDTTKFLNSLESNLDLISILCYRENLREGVLDTISQIRSAHINQWLVNSQGEARSLAIAYSSGLLEKTMDIHKIRGNDEDSVMISIRAILNKMKKKMNKKRDDHRISRRLRDISIDQALGNAANKMSASYGNNLNQQANIKMGQSPTSNNAISASQRMSSLSEQMRRNSKKSSSSSALFLDLQGKSEGYPEFFLIIDGVTLEIIYKNENLLAHFAFIVYYSLGIIGYYMN